MSPNPFNSGPKEQYRKSMRRRYKQSLMSSGMTEEAAESVIQKENIDEKIAEAAEDWFRNWAEAYTSESE